MQRLIIILIALLCCPAAQGHHWVRDIYDENLRFTIEAEVRKFALINPHPHLFVEITSIPRGTEADGIAVGQTWTLEMDNKRELTALGIDRDTFVPGDRIIVAVDPSRNTLYRENTMYLRAVEHPRKGFVYVHNVRTLFPIDPAGESLSKYIDKVR